MKTFFDYYTKEQTEHVIRVYKIAYQDLRTLSFKAEDRIMIHIVAMGHELLENTDCTPEEFEDETVRKTIELLTYDPVKESYYDYMKKICEEKSKIGIYARIVKTADIIDSLNQKTPLIPKLQHMYSVAIPMLIESYSN